VTDTTSGASLQLNRADDARAALGTTRVANQVVASIAALAALEVGGVHAMYHPGAQPLERITRRAHAHRGVRVDFLDGALRLDVYVVVEAGGNVQAIGAEVQRRVVDAVDRMLDLSIAEVNVFISEVVFI
jgi:uncharacterized alkaline shock family protein YloU